MTIDSLLLVDDEDLFHLIFEDACNMLDIAISVECINTTDEADQKFKNWFLSNEIKHRPDCVFVDINMLGSTYDGIELIRRINNIYGNGVIIGVISSSTDVTEIQRAIDVGAQFWIVKTDNVESRLVQFKDDYDHFKNKSIKFRIYK